MVNLYKIEFPTLQVLPLLLGIVLLAAAFILSLRGTAILEDAVLRRRLALLRAVALLCLLFALIQPVLTMEKAERRKNGFEVLLDLSPSMRTEDRLFERAAAFIRKNREAFSALSEKYDLRFSAFSADTVVDSVAGFPVHTATQYRDVSSLSDALSAVAGREPAGALLFSDGLFRDKIAANEALGLPLLETACRFYPVMLYRDTGGADLALAGVASDEFAYVKNNFHLKARITASGHGSMTVPVRITRERETVATAEIRLKKGKREYELDMDFIPDKTGHAVYRISLPRYSFEKTHRNNVRAFSLKVIRDRIGVLHVCGRPSWDGRFLRRTLKQDPAVDVVAFYILRTASDVINVGSAELSLIEFPYRQLFDKELKGFDLVVFQNFSYRHFFSRPYLENVSRYVEAGGAFLMIGGDLSFSEGGYRHTPLARVLPYQLVTPRKRSLAQAFSVKQTRQGRNHPITAEVSDIANFPFEGLNALGQPLAHCQTLLETRGGEPFLGIREAGKGRTAAIGGDCLWMVNFVNVGKGAGNRSYQMLVRRIVRWLIKDPALGALSFSGVQAEYGTGASISFSVRLAGARKGRTLRLRIVDGAGKTVDSRARAAGRAAVYPFDFKNPGEGLYVLKAELIQNKVIQDHASEVFRVSSLAEYGDTPFNSALLEKLAKESRGRIIEYDGAGLLDRIDVPEKIVSRVIEKRSFPLWNRLILILIAVGFFAMEWFIRKRNGLL
jgi:hypothetical protein